jgi:hypothetical protein
LHLAARNIRANTRARAQRDTRSADRLLWRLLSNRPFGRLQLRTRLFKPGRLGLRELAEGCLPFEQPIRQHRLLYHNREPAAAWSATVLPQRRAVGLGPRRIRNRFDRRGQLLGSAAAR